ncbi:MAG TPA: adenylosuccinate synthase [Turneriella sp.]|nr:adenylosuccinate synthase [Turneriella sp.]HMY10854.1 adenylosuccinate synthase [Turneriella sp.]HNA78472.1 adenylosuccinate synthase [Turneriella sp.]HNE18327.1 adenylosuccinate synthase [Turneriella sp.]HNJ65238.1 adenylosuccinate synthase [Turneriella sp.]
MPATLIVGTQWGDEGKAKVIDYLAKETDIVVRYQGGANAGHTVKVGEDKYIFRLIPSGILYPKTICVLGGGMVIDPDAMFDEIAELEAKGIQPTGRLRIADNAHLLMPYHKEIDVRSEEASGAHKIGTTKRGIGACYSDKVNRQGIRIGMLYSDEFFASTLPRLVEQKNRLLTKMYDAPPIDLAAMKEKLLALREKLRDMVVNAPYYLNMELASGKRVLLEGAQGTMLDLDFGTYPYVTSSNPTTGGALSGSGVSFQYLKSVIGIAKAYSTRVGEGPYPTECFGEEGEILRKAGNEFGSVTGRPRRCGWFDAEVVRHAARINGLTSIALTKIDVLDTFKTIKVATGYELDGKRIDYFPSCNVANVKVIYEEFPGWNEPTSHITKLKNLPKNARRYIDAIAKFCGVPIAWVSVGPGRENTIAIK